MWLDFDIDRMQPSEELWSDITNAVGFNPLDQGSQLSDIMSAYLNDSRPDKMAIDIPYKAGRFGKYVQCGREAGKQMSATAPIF